ncbi:hypothetical protein AD932_03970 [Gluconobacter oxydans]|nr:hypothetical protein AD932_03970 [Gluconobacter oxydans]
MPLQNFVIQLLNLGLYHAKLIQKGMCNGSHFIWPCILIFMDEASERLGADNTFRSNDTDFTQMSSQSIDEHGFLLHQQIATAVQHQDRLLLYRFDRNELHGRSCDGFTDGFGIASIGFTAFEIGFDVAGWHQSDGMS